MSVGGQVSDHKVADIFPFDALRGRDPGHRLAAATIEGERDAHLLAIAAGQFEAVRAPAQG